MKKILIWSLQILACVFFINVLPIYVFISTAGMNFTAISSPGLIQRIAELEEYANKPAYYTVEKTMEFEAQFKELCTNDILQDQIFQQAMITLAWLRKGRQEQALFALDKLKRNFKSLQAVGASTYIINEPVGRGNR